MKRLAGDNADSVYALLEHKVTQMRATFEEVGTRLGSSMLELYVGIALFETATSFVVHSSPLRTHIYCTKTIEL